MATDDNTDAPATNEMPWTSAQMPCVYCGQPIDRQSDRCPHCKTSYSIAVRRASREVEGSWFYLEPRNASNRGVDFRTMLKLIEKGRLRRDSVVRGPTTHQDWMYAAETPQLSKYLGVCPHCYGPAAADQEFCGTCDRSLDERPARLRPGADAPKAAALFAERDAMEETLAGALATHDMAVAASTVAPRTEEPSHLDEILAREKSAEMPAAGGHPRRPRRAPGERRAKPHVVILLTIVTVIPLALLMMYIPIYAVLPGDPSTPGTTAYNVRTNQQSVRDWIGGLFGAEPAPPGESPEVKDLFDRARAAVNSGDYTRARDLYNSLISKYRGTDVETRAESGLSDIDRLISEKQYDQSLRDRFSRAQDAIEAGNYDAAEAILNAMTSRDESAARLLDLDVATLRDRIAVARLRQEEGAARQKRRDEVKSLLDKARYLVGTKDYKGALTVYQEIQNKYPAEDLPAGTDLASLIAVAQNGGKPQPQPAPDTGKPARDPDQARADSLWRDVKSLEGQGKYTDALKKAEELESVPEKYRPKDLAAKIDYLKDKIREEQKKAFFGMDLGTSAPRQPDLAPKQPDPAPKQPDPAPTPAPAETNKAKADRLWGDAIKLAEKSQYTDAVKLLEQIEKLPPDVHPPDLKAKLEEFRKKRDEEGKASFFGIDG